MSRERTTWNREAISRTAAMPKQADPYLMNQDHVSQNPRADKYMNGTPSSWAEDVHTPNEWEKEYAGGQTKRNEIGLPDTRPETFNHPEHAKSASNDLLVKKADLAVKVARMFLPTAAEAVVEDQAVSLMALSDADLIETHNRLAQDQGQQEPPKDQGQQQATTQPVAQGQQDQGQQAPPKDQGQQQAGQQDQGQEPKDQGQQQAGMQQQSAGYQAAMQQCMEAMGKGDQQGMQAAIQQMVQEAAMQQEGSQADFPGGQWGHNNPVAKTTKRAQGDQGQGQGQGQGQQQKQQAGMQDQQAMVQQMVQQAVQQMQQQQVQQEPGQEQGQGQGGQDPFDMQASDDDLLNNMLAPATAGAQVAADPSLSGIGDIQLDAPIMDTGDVQLGPEDDVLKDLFASQETEDAQHAQQQQGQQHQAATVVRTAATRTVGTRPSAGVSRVGGSGAATSKTAAAGDVDKLQSLWASAPDVREHFGI